MKKWMHFQVSCFPQSDSLKKKFCTENLRKISYGQTSWAERESWTAYIGNLKKNYEPKQSDREALNHLQWYHESKAVESTYSMFLVPLWNGVTVEGALKKVAPAISWS